MKRNHMAAMWGNRGAIGRVRRIMKSPDGHEDGNPGGGEGNSGVNDGNTGTPPAGGNNDGNDFNPDAFWGSSSPDGQQNNPDGGQPNGGTPPANPAEEIATAINTANFGVFFDDAVTAEINDGNFENFNQRMNQGLQAATRQSVQYSMQVMKMYGDRILAQVREEMAGTLEGRDDQAQLIRDFPSAANPQIAPMIQQVYGQALQNTGGDRVKAVTQAKRMLALMAQTSGNDLDLRVAPRSQYDDPPAPQTNWLDELNER